MRIFILVIMLVTLPAAVASAHSTPDLCRADEDPVEQCGEDHSCDVDESVSADIGVCQGTIENTDFRTCDMRNGDEDCPDGFECLIGELDPDIGACFEAEGDSHDHDGHDHDGHSDDDEGCSTVSVDASLGSVIVFVLLGLIWRRRIDPQ